MMYSKKKRWTAIDKEVRFGLPKLFSANSVAYNIDGFCRAYLD